MSKEYKISELIMNYERPFYEMNEEIKQFPRYREVNLGSRTRYLTWVDDKHMQSIQTPNGRELTPEELFDFVIGNNITDYTRTEGEKADVAIVLGNGLLPVTRERAIKAFELYRRGIAKKIIFTGGIHRERDKKGLMHPSTLDEYMDGSSPEIDWQELTEADWGAETFISEVFEEDHRIHSEILTDEFLRSIGVNPEDVLIEPLSKSTQENALFCRNIFESEEIETGEKIKSVILVTTVTHGSRAMRQFQKLFGDSIELSWCPSTLDLEKYGRMKDIIHAPVFDVEAFQEELKKIYCGTPELIQKLMGETANHRNAFILGDIFEPTIMTTDRQGHEEYDER